jgi:hypothetical protein
MKITEYKTVAEDTIRGLDEEVNRLIAQGFQPFGSPYYIGETTGSVDAPVCQALVKFEKE